MQGLYSRARETEAESGVSLDVFFLWHRFEVHRRLRAFMVESGRRCIVREQRARCWQRYHRLEEQVILTKPKSERAWMNRS